METTELDNPEQLDASYSLVLEEARELPLSSILAVNLDVVQATDTTLAHYDHILVVLPEVEELLKCVNVSIADKFAHYLLALRKAEVIYQKAHIDQVNGDMTDDDFDEIAVLRDRFFTLFIYAYAELRRALCYMYWDTDKGDSIAPPLFPIEDPELRSRLTETTGRTKDEPFD